MRHKLCIALMAAIVLAATAAPRAAEPESYDGPQWPNVPDNGARWPSLPAADTIYPTALAQPTWADVDPIVTGTVDRDVTGGTARWPTLPAQPQPSPFAFEAGLRYWYSSGLMRFAFSNGSPLFGTPTSMLDWEALVGHTGEAFARLDHKPTGLFVKGVVGLGGIVDGHIDDRDYFAGPILFSDTRSEVKNGDITFASVDVGWGFAPAPGYHLGAFIGYQYWQEKATAFGLYCHQATLVFAGCPAAGAVVVGYGTAVFVYEPTWHALRLGLESRVAITDRWSVRGEIVGIPFAALRNEDSHLLRQSLADLGPAPNVITESNAGFGIQAEAFVNYAVTPNIEIGAGVRYWELIAKRGTVDFGPAFTSGLPLENFDHQRLGLLLQVKGKF
jgi:hypothetical protein